jgi:hypothetical protein
MEEGDTRRLWSKVFNPRSRDPSAESAQEGRESREPLPEDGSDLGWWLGPIEPVLPVLPKHKRRKAGVTQRKPTRAGRANSPGGGWLF